MYHNNGYAYDYGCQPQMQYLRQAQYQQHHRCYQMRPQQPMQYPTAAYRAYSYNMDPAAAYQQQQRVAQYQQYARRQQAMAYQQRLVHFW